MPCKPLEQNRSENQTVIDGIEADTLASSGWELPEMASVCLWLIDRSHLTFSH